MWRRAKAVGLAPMLAPMIVNAGPATRLDGAAPLPRVLVTRPSAGYAHPASKAEIERLLRFFGPACTYGLRLIALVRRPVDPRCAGSSGDSLLRFAALRPPGAVLLYEQRASPWILTGRIEDGAAERFRRAGAGFEIVGAGLQTVVSWPDFTLRDFMLFDVLLHELGHHQLQHHKGKRLARVARTRDHERFADRFAQRARLLWELHDCRLPG